MLKRNKRIVISVAIVVLAVVCGYIYYHYNVSTKTNSQSLPVFHGPNGAPHVVGPTTLPPKE